MHKNSKVIQSKEEHDLLNAMSLKFVIRDVQKFDESHTQDSTSVFYSVNLDIIFDEEFIIDSGFYGQSFMFSLSFINKAYIDLNTDDMYGALKLLNQCNTDSDFKKYKYKSLFNPIIFHNGTADEPLLYRCHAFRIPFLKVVVKGGCFTIECPPNDLTTIIDTSAIMCGLKQANKHRLEFSHTDEEINIQIERVLQNYCSKYNYDNSSTEYQSLKNGLHQGLLTWRSYLDCISQNLSMLCGKDDDVQGYCKDILDGIFCENEEKDDCFSGFRTNVLDKCNKDNLLRSMTNIASRIKKYKTYENYSDLLSDYVTNDLLNVHYVLSAPFGKEWAGKANLFSYRLLNIHNKFSSAMHRFYSLFYCVNIVIHHVNIDSINKNCEQFDCGDNKVVAVDRLDKLLLGFCNKGVVSNSFSVIMKIEYCDGVDPGVNCDSLIQFLVDANYHHGSDISLYACDIDGVSVSNPIRTNVLDTSIWKRLSLPDCTASDVSSVVNSEFSYVKQGSNNQKSYDHWFHYRGSSIFNITISMRSRPDVNHFFQNSIKFQIFLERKFPINSPMSFPVRMQSGHSIVKKSQQKRKKCPPQYYIISCNEDNGSRAITAQRVDEYELSIIDLLSLNDNKLDLGGGMTLCYSKDSSIAHDDEKNKSKIQFSQLPECSQKAIMQNIITESQNNPTLSDNIKKIIAKLFNSTNSNLTVNPEPFQEQSCIIRELSDGDDECTVQELSEDKCLVRELRDGKDEFAFRWLKRGEDGCTVEELSEDKDECKSIMMNKSGNNAENSVDTIKNEDNQNQGFSNVLTDVYHLTSLEDKGPEFTY